MPGFSVPYDPPIPATDIHDGSVSNAEFGCLNGVTSAIQTQIDSCASDFAGHASSTVGAHGMSAFGAGFVASVGASAGRSALGTVIGTDVLAPNGNGSGLTGLTTSQISGLGTIATQAASSVTITGGSISGITDLAVADGGTGASSATAARNNLGCGTAATKDFPATGNAAAGEVVLGSDTRLTDSRTPTAHTHDDRYFTESEIIAGYQPLDATTTALAAWDWSSGVEVATFTADDTLSILRVGTGANNLVQLNGSGQLPAVSGALLTGIAGIPTCVKSTLSSDLVQSHVAGTFQDIFSVTLATGRWRIYVHVDSLRSASQSVILRFITGTAALSGSLNDAVGLGIMEASTTHLRIAATGTWTSTNAARFSGDNNTCHILLATVNVTSSGTFKVQGNLNTTGTMTWQAGSFILCEQDA